MTTPDQSIVPDPAPTPNPSLGIGQRIVAKLQALKLLFLRDPAIALGLFAGAIQFVSAQIFPLSVDQQGTLNAVAVALAGVITAFVVTHDQGVPAIVGLCKALIALALAFGLHWSPEVQASAMSALSILGSLWIRAQVTAPVQVSQDGQLYRTA